MSSSYRVGVVGLGAIASTYGKPEESAPYCHVGGVRYSNRVHLAGVCDLSAAARANFGATWGSVFPDTRVFDSMETMMQEGPLDIIAVCVRGPFHFSVMKEVLASPHAPRAVFLEKPPTCSLEEHDEMMALARKKNIPITVSYSRHWNPRTLKMAGLVREGLIGRVHTVVGYNGGAVLSFASHTTDLICEFAGYDARAVSARGTLGEETRDGYEAEPSLEHLTIEFDSGVLGVQVGASGEHGQFYADVFGTRGRVQVGMYFEPHAFGAQNQPIDLGAQLPPGASVFQLAYDQIAAHLDGGPLPDCTNDEFAVVNEIGFAAIESLHANGARVELPNANRSRRIWSNG